MAVGQGCALWKPVTVTRHVIRYCYAVTLHPVTVTSHAIRYCYAVTLAPLFFAHAPNAQVNPSPLETQQLSTWYKRHHRKVVDWLQAAPRDESPPLFSYVQDG